MFAAMMDGIKEESVGFLFNLEVQVEQQAEEVPVGKSRSGRHGDGVPLRPVTSPPQIRAKGLEAPQRRDRLHFSAPTVDGEGGIVEGDLPDDEPPSAPKADGLTRAERRKQQGKTSRRRKK